MGNFLVRSLGGQGGAGGPLGKRAALRLSDGTAVMVVADSNRSGQAGAAGDNSNTGKIYIYSSPDSQVWTLRATIVTANTLAAGRISYSACTDSADSVHVIWIETDSTVKWAKYTYSSGTFTAGSTSTIYNRSGAFNIYRVDIDCFANNQAVCALWTQSVSGTGSAMGVKVAALVLSSTGSVIYSRTTQILSGVTAKSGSEDITVTATHDAVVGNIGTFAMIASKQPSAGTDTGDWLAIGLVNLSTGAEQKFGVDSNIQMGGRQYRRYMLFCSDGAREITYGTISAGNGAVYGYRRGNISTFGTLTWQGSLLIQGLVDNFPDVPSTNGYYTASIQYGDNTYKMMTFAFSLANWHCVNITIDTSRNSFRPVALYIDQGEVPAVGSLTCVSGGNNRNFNVNFINFLLHLPIKNFQARSINPPLPLAPANIGPGNGATVSTGLPSVSSDIKLPYPSPAGIVSQFYYIAQDPGLTINRKSILSTDKIGAYNTDPFHNAKVTDVFSITDRTDELSQGTWYIQAFSIDEWNRIGPGSAITSFTVSHPPVAANLHPTGGQVGIYGAGSIVFTWAFTDPYRYDNQTAFEIQVQDLNGNAVFDSGKVSSSSSSAVVNIPSADKDIQLQWRIALWDKDDVEGNFSAWQAFYLSDPPIVTITSPTANQVSTTGAPIITWDNGVGVNKSQVKYEVRIYDSITGQLIYDFFDSAPDTTYTIPVGIIHNLKSYTVRVTVTDSLGLQGTSAPVGFSTSWTPPAGAGLVRTYQMQYVSDGFVFIGWDNGNYDDRFIAWNLYRRLVGESIWTLIYSVSDVSSTYGYRDYDVKTGRLYQYAVTQVINVSGDSVESVLSANADVTVPSASYWLVDPLGIVRSVPIFNVTADKYTDEQETAVYTVVGIGRHVDEGDILGVNGSMTIELFNKSTGLIESINQFLNPSMQSAQTLNQPDSWVIDGLGSFGTISTDYLTFYEPAPNGYLTNLVIRSSGLGSTAADAITVAQDVTLDRLPCQPGQTFDHSEWYAVEPVAGNVLTLPVVKSKVTYYASDNSVISVETITSSVVDTYEPSSSSDLYTGAWKRFRARHTMPRNTDHLNVQTQILTTTAGQYGIITGGSQLEKTLTPYFDGDSRGATWTAAEYTSSSYNNGYYTATDQREDIQAIRHIGRPVYLKTPFGQSFYVKLPDNDFDRMAGTTEEFGTMTLPYLEVAF